MFKSLTFDNIAFSLGAVVVAVATIAVVHNIIAHPPGDYVLPQDVPRATESVRYAGALAAWGPHIGAKQLAEIYPHWQRIENEVKLRRQHAWAGRYLQRDNRGSTLEIAPQSGFVLFHRQGDGAIGNVGLAEGDEVREADCLRMHYAKRLDIDKGALPDKLYPVHWGSRRYLLTDANLHDLVNALNGQTAFPDTLVSTFPANVADGDKQPTGTPALPAPYGAQLLKKPIAAKVTSTVDKQGHYAVDIGSSEGVFPGMQLYVVADQSLVLEVVRVSEHTAVVENPAAGLAQVALGATVSSRQAGARS